MIDDKYHFIGGYMNRKHLLWNNERKKFEEIHRFTEFTAGLEHHRLIHIKSKQI